MDSLWGRVSQVFSLYALALSICGLFNWSTAYTRGSLARNNAMVSVSEIGNPIVHKYLGLEGIPLKLNMTSDYSKTFGWNTKQIFVQAYVTYQTTSSVDNSVVVWDHIITSPSDSIVDLKNVAAEYLLRDPKRKSFKGQDAEIHVQYQYMPKIGLFQDIHQYKSLFALTPDKALL